MIELSNVTVRYRNRTSLENASLRIAPGEFVYLLGPSGAGKSTLLKLLYMDIIPEEGQVRIGEFESSNVKKKEIPYLRRQLGIVFQDFRLLRDRSVYDNIAFTLLVTETPKSEIPKKVMRALAQVGLSTKKNSMPYELSGGEQQRVVIARALVNEPMVILADEPTGNLDPDTSMEIMQLLTKINAEGTAIVMATHDYNIVKALPKRIIRVEGGKITDAPN
ncbi:cell division ATP-binding protein FtsE [bacterium]|nr:cell division ATP-binding protein FtsE [bacterium]NUN45796.1 cell division ATP-binding protein FtsE [bacterium]HMV27337.1 cell division ATP-binding protein FtsE [bacterium]HMW36231.1 cell division ATP-binding protein FtsE [bacterium]HMY37528.1 cell division ATP-binding protein FtsE [bacterium]